MKKIQKSLVIVALVAIFIFFFNYILKFQNDLKVSKYRTKGDIIRARFEILRACDKKIQIARVRNLSAPLVEKQANIPCVVSKNVNSINVKICLYDESIEDFVSLNIRTNRIYEEENLSNLLISCVL